MENFNLNQLRDCAFQCAKEHGFYDNHQPDEHECLEVLCEVSEAVNAYRKGMRANVGIFETTLKYTPEGSSEEDKKKFYAYLFEENIKDTYEDELADIAIRLLSFFGYKKIDLSYCERKLQENYSRYVEATFDQFFYDLNKRCVDMLIATNKDKTFALFKLITWALSNEIDLKWHIEHKMKYNQLRPRLNGKIY